LVAREHVWDERTHEHGTEAGVLSRAVDDSKNASHTLVAVSHHQCDRRIVVVAMSEEVDCSENLLYMLGVSDAWCIAAAAFVFAAK
jgi:hypothetical protein